MTDTSSTFTTLSTPQLNPVTAPSIASPTVNGALSDSYPPEEDEPYTIKCICAFQDDDGNTVFCEKCETWQHIECYYHGKKVPDVHNCADCEPRPLDGKRATERQRKLREQTDGGDRKTTKRATSKSHKKKVKDVEHTNGWHTHDRHDSVSASRDQPPPAKRPKTSHRPSNSVTSMNGVPVLAPDSRKRAHSTAQSYPSPTKSPLSQIELSLPRYSHEFLHLYDDDQGKANLSIRDNFNTIGVTGKLKAWTHEPHELAKATNNKPYSEIFTHSNDPLNPEAFPSVSSHQISNPDIELDGKHPAWQILKVDVDVPYDSLVGEIKGLVGELREYCHDPANRWPELRHPEPFVFFHPTLPIYIDGRREGTKFRYLRRSCRPNVTMKTIIDKEGEYHYCFYAKQDIPAGSELTATWYLDQNVLNQTGKQEPNGDNKNELPLPEVWASRVLANFGDCACDARQQPCMLAPLDRRRPLRPTEGGARKQANGRAKKTKGKHMSPPVIGRGSTSRAGSETVKGPDEDEQYENRSTSGSVRSKPRSRDMTPTNPSEAPLGTGLTDREKRKIAAAEKTFERLEQDQQEKKKKKRSSGSSALNTPSLNTSVSATSRILAIITNMQQKQLESFTYPQPTSPSTAQKLYYVDAGTSRPYSASPPGQIPISKDTPNSTSGVKQHGNPTPVSAFHRPAYVDTSVQTDDDSPISDVSPPVKRRRFTPLTQRLLKRCHEDRLKFEETEQRRLSFSAGNTLPSPISPSAKPESSALSPEPQKEQAGAVDTEMKDVTLVSSPTTVSSPTAIKSPTTVDGSMLPPPPLPSQAAHTAKAYHPPVPLNGQRLQITNMPPVSAVSSNSGTGTPLAVTPTSTSSQSPVGLTFANSLPPLQTSNTSPTSGSALTAPSPVKKKLSLGDYMSRRNATPVTEKASSVTQGSGLTASEFGGMQEIDGRGSIPLIIDESTEPDAGTGKPSVTDGTSGSEIVTVDTDVAMKDAPADPPVNSLPAPAKDMGTIETTEATEPLPTDGTSPASVDTASAADAT